MRFLLALLLTLAACRGAKPAPLAVSDGGPATLPLPLVSITPIDAAPEYDAQPIRAADVVVGKDAEKIIAAQTRDDVGGAGADGEPAWGGIRSDGYGPLRLGQSRAEVLRILGAPNALHRVATKAGEPTVETALLPGEDGRPYLKVRVYAGRLHSLDLFAPHTRGITDAGIGVGATMEQAVESHGPARRVDDSRTGEPLGWVLTDLPGVIWVTAVKLTADDEAPEAGDRIIRALIVGPEMTSPAD